MVNIKEVADFVAANNNISKAAALRITKDVFGFIKSEVLDGNEVNIDKFGKFESEQKEARTGRNPSTGAAIEIAAKKVVKFKAAKDFKDQTAVS